MFDIGPPKIIYYLGRVRQALDRTRSLGIFVQGSHLKSPPLSRQICRRMSDLYLVSLSGLIARRGDHYEGSVALTASMAFIA